jgi:hypothetical protein
MQIRSSIMFQFQPHDSRFMIRLILPGCCLSNDNAKRLSPGMLGLQSVLVAGDIQAPVTCVLDPLVTANTLGEKGHLKGQAAEVVSNTWVLLPVVVCSKRGERSST